MFFLDNMDDADSIRTQLGQVRSRARKNGYAVAIGHYRKITLGVLAEEIPKLKQEGFQLLSLSELIETLSSRQY